ncbi:MAG: TonB-dependent receptor, partial [Melioribacteraceae bacterium]|nr:TonB-dependent receptor [Melioribacteraceae bacterium]
GEYVTDRTELYPNISDVDPLNRARFEGTFGGPVISNKVKIFLSGIYENYQGLYNGQRLYNTTDSYLSREAFSADDPRSGSSSDPYWFNPYGNDSTNSSTGDNAWVTMNPSTNLNLQGNLLFNITSLIRLKYEVVYDKGEYQTYNRLWKFNPDGRGTNYDDGLIQTLDFTHTVNENLFYTLKASYGYNQHKYYLYEDVSDPRYLPAGYSNPTSSSNTNQIGLYSAQISNTSYYAGGTRNYRENRNTRTYNFKGDLVTQVANHEFKIGFETRIHKIDFEAYNVQFLRLNPDGSTSNLTNDDLLYNPDLKIIRQQPDSDKYSLLDTYSKEPVEASFYILDKMELADRFILNFGLRYEYFDPKAPYNYDLSSDLENLQSGIMYKSLADAEPKHQLSPRISVSYPITAESVIRFSYGHFYQHGNLSSLYRNPKFFVANVGSTPTFGNANVNMQRSIQYEMGLQQQFTENLKMELTGYYKDVRDYIYTQTVFTNSGREYRVLTNLAYSNVRGVTFRLERRRNPFDIFYATLDYTFQIADGNRTEPTEDLFYSEAAGKQTETYLVPLSFDRRHVLNITVGLFQQSNWAIGLIYNLQAGSPYTPSFPPEVVPVTFEQNS